MQKCRREKKDIFANSTDLNAKIELKQDEIDKKTKETDVLEEMLVKAERVFLYTLNEEAGSCNETFQEGWKQTNQHSLARPQTQRQERQDLQTRLVPGHHLSPQRIYKKMSHARGEFGWEEFDAWFVSRYE
jgi:hypothetical protein